MLDKLANAFTDYMLADGLVAQSEVYLLLSVENGACYRPTHLFISSDRLGRGDRLHSLPQPD